MDQPNMQFDETIASSLKELEQSAPMAQPSSTAKTLPSEQRQHVLLGFVVLALIVSVYLFLSLGAKNRLTEEDLLHIEQGTTEQADRALFNQKQ